MMRVDGSGFMSILYFAKGRAMSNGIVIRAMACAMVALCLSGCHFTPPKSVAFWKWNKEQSPAMPEKLLAVWSDTVLHQPGQPGVRGFGGRVYFYQSQGTDPVKVDGALAVYVFDADQLDPYEQKPLRKFVYTAEQFKEHYSATALGPSYSVWLPWDEVGGPARRLSLIARFEGSEGGTVISDPAIKLLPGLSKLASAEKNKEEQASHTTVRTVGHQKQHSEPVIPAEFLQRRDIQTIDLPPSFKKHFHSQPPPSAPDDSVQSTPLPVILQPSHTEASVESPWEESRSRPRNIREGRPIAPPR